MAAKDRLIRVAVDALGGDNAPQVVCEGAALALGADDALQVHLVGPESVVAPVAAEHADKVVPVVADECIGMDEHPANAVKRKKGSTIVVGCKLVRDGAADGFFSAGSTGACMAAGTLYIGRAEGIMRPAIATALPAPTGPVVLLDSGANADCKAEYLVQFAHMGRVYARSVLGVSEPRVGLLNIGEEATKGNALAIEAFAALQGAVPGFAGNVEGKQILGGGFDVVVTDGFTGNVVLKTIEGVAKMLFGELKGVFSASLKGKLAAGLAMEGLRGLKHTFDADATGGAPLLGLRGECLIGHGSSNARAIASGILATADCVRSDVSGTVARAIRDEEG